MKGMRWRSCEKPKEDQKTKDRAFYVPVDEEFANNGKSS